MSEYLYPEDVDSKNIAIDFSDKDKADISKANVYKVARFPL